MFYLWFGCPFIVYSITNLNMDNSDKVDSTVAIEPSIPKDKGLWRDLTAYWIFGLCNNFGYVVMLTAAVRHYFKYLLNCNI